MIKLENIIIINKEDDGYYISFNDGSDIILKSKRAIIPLLLLIKYGKASRVDYDNERYEYLKNLLYDKIELDIFDKEYKEKSKPFSDLIEIEGFTFIKRKYENGRYYYILDRKDHKLLFKERNNNEYTLDENEEKRIMKEQGYRCMLCDKIITKDDLSIDYIIPLSRGGKKDISNVQILCSECFKKKRKECKNCIELCDINKCPLYKKTNTINAMTVTRVAMRKTK